VITSDRCRSRAIVNRPFTRIKALETGGMLKFQSEIKRLRGQILRRSARINDLQQQKRTRPAVYFVPEQSADW